MDEKPEIPTENAAGASEKSWSLWSPLNIVLIAVCGVLLYKIFTMNRTEPPQLPKRLPKMKRQDFTLQQLRQYDGSGKNEDDPERILVAVDGVVFDMSNNGRRFYGPGGPYSLFAGRDASRALATFSLTEDQFREEYDDLSDLKPLQLEQIREWAQQYREKYDVVGRLLKPGEQPKVYDDEEESADKAGEAKKTK